MSKVWKIIGWGIGILIFGFLLVYNFCNNEQFFDVSVTSLLTVMVAVVFSYWFVQSRNDKRRKNEKLDNLLYRIQEIILQEEFIQSSNEKIQRSNLIKQRSVGNKIQYLKTGCEKNKDVTQLVDELQKEFERFREFYGEHYKDQEYMMKSDKELLNYITLMDDIADKIHVTLL